jgi:hypothetical protein
MKEEKMKADYRKCIAGIWIFAFLITTVLTAQNLLVGGNMEDESAWNVHFLDSEDFPDYEFNFDGDVATFGEGGSLNVYCEVVYSANMIFWQPVQLVPGESYEFSGAFKDLTGGALQNFWCEVLLSTEEPPPPDSTGDYGGDVLVAFNTWDGCGAGIDGTFQDEFCKGPGPVFTVPDSDATEVTYYFVLNIGVWAGGTPIQFDVIVDELSLVPLGGSGIAYHEWIIGGFELYQNYPNPFNPETTIAFSIRENTWVCLKIFNSLGQEVATLVDEMRQPGTYRTDWNAAEYQSGFYVCQLSAGHEVISKKMMLVK